MPSNHLILCCPLLLLPSIFPSTRGFSNESALHIRWPNIGVSTSASVFPMNTQDWFPLGWTAWISLQSKDIRSPTWQKLPWWKLNMKKTQWRGSDKKPSVLATGTVKNQLSRKLTRLSLRFQKTSRSLFLWLEGHMPKKILIPLQSLVSFSFEPLWTGEQQWVQLRDSGSGYFSVCPEGSTILCVLVAVTQTGGGSSVLNLLWAKD